MPTFERFEDIEAWKIARELVKEVYRITSRIPFSEDFRFKNQIRASAGSIMDNIAEGFERGGTQEFKQFLRYAKGSCGEVRSQLYRAIDCGHINQNEFDLLSQNANRISAMINGLIKYLTNTSYKGINYF